LGDYSTIQVSSIFDPIKYKPLETLASSEQTE